LPTTDAIKQLANQELSKRAYMSRDVLARGNVMPPADRGAFGVTGALTDYGTGMQDAASSSLKYMLDTSLADMGRDAARFGSAMVEGMVEDPLMTAVDFIPGAGLAMGSYEAEQLRGQALEAERAGQFDLAQSLRSQAGAIAAMSMIPGGRTARRGAKMDMANKVEPGQSTLRLEGFGPVVQTMREGEIIRPSMYDIVNEKGYSIDPFMANVDPSAPRPDTISSGTFRARLNEYENNPIARQREQARLLGGEIVSPQDAFMQTATLEQLQGRPLIMMPADRLAYGQVNKVAGVDVRPFNIQGGPQYADVNKEWASMAGAAKAKQLHANKVREETGLDPVAVYASMAEDGSNFSVGPSIATARYLEATGGLTPEGVKILDAEINKLKDEGDTKGIAKAWAGYKSPEQFEEFLTIDKGEGPTLGNRRKAIMPLLNKGGLTNHGMPNMTDVYASVNNPELRGMPTGAAGYRALIMTDKDPNNMRFDPTTNQSYNTIIEAQQALALPVESMTTWDTMFPSMAAARSDKRPDRAYRSSTLSGSAPDYQMADQEWLDNAMANPLGGVRR